MGKMGSTTHGSMAKERTEGRRLTREGESGSRRRQLWKRTEEESQRRGKEEKEKAEDEG